MELIVKLKQHTPIIHFQWEQKGATLRATELKPKLDAFLRHKNIEVLKKHFKDKDNLPYKVRINNSPEQPIEIEEEYTARNGKTKKRLFPSFFGNIGETAEKRFAFSTKIEVKFLSFYPEIIGAIAQNLSEFFFKTNFGTRQSKGFGSFYIDPSDACFRDPLSFKGYYIFTVQTNETEFYKKYKKLFGDIDLFYKTLRSGINLKDRNGNTLFYFKSLMFLYAKQQNWTWDKKVIKSNFIDPPVLNKQKKAHNNCDLLIFSGSKEYLVRDLLGVATSQAYMSERFELQYDEQNEIQRFKSPITFKPIETTTMRQFKVYLITSPLPNDIFDKDFTIHKVIEEKIKGNRAKTRVCFITLKTPPLTNPVDIDIDKYLRFALSIDIDKHVDSNFHSHEYFKIIKQIYSELKESAKNVRK